MRIPRNRIASSDVLSESLAYEAKVQDKNPALATDSRLSPSLVKATAGFLLSNIAFLVIAVGVSNVV